MATMIRKYIYLEPDQDVLLKRLAKETGMSEAALIRQAINRYARVLARSQCELGVWEEERVFIQQLMEHPATPAPRQWRRDDLHER